MSDFSNTKQDDLFFKAGQVDKGAKYPKAPARPQEPIEPDKPWPRPADESATPAAQATTFQQTVQAAQERLTQPIPPGYIEVHLSSMGKLSLPAVVHVRNYSLDEAVLLSEMSEADEADLITQLVANMTYEKINRLLIHEQEAIEILVNVHAAFWGSSIEGFRYFVDDSLQGDALVDKNNLSIATVPLKAINTKNLDPKVKEPVGIPESDKPNARVIKLKYPRLGNALMVDTYLKMKYIVQEEQFANIRHTLERNRNEKASLNYNVKEYEAYQAFLKEKSALRLKLLQAQMLYGYDDVVFTSLEQAVEFSPQVPMDVWNLFAEFRRTDGFFGLQPEVTFDCSVTHQPITRRFNFRPMVFIPSLDKPQRSRPTFSFG